jgi:hypothetical protein
MFCIANLSVLRFPPHAIEGTANGGKEGVQQIGRRSNQKRIV